MSRSSPNSLTTIWACTPESMCSRRWAIGWPMETETGSTASLARMWAYTSSLVRAERARSTSISELWTPSACSSSSARPVRRPTLLTSGMSRISRSAMAPSRLELRERDAGVVLKIDQDGAFVERRQERPRQQCAAEAGSQHADRDHGKESLLVRKRPAQEPGVAGLEMAHDEAVALSLRARCREQVVGQHRCQRDGHDERGEDRDDVGDAERHEQAALDAGQREQRHEHQDDDHRRVEDARADLLARPRDHLEHGQRRRPLPVLLQPAQDVLDAHHGIVDQLADGDGEAAERHGVDRRGRRR